LKHFGGNWGRFCRDGTLDVGRVEKALVGVAVLGRGVGIVDGSKVGLNVVSLSVVRIIERNREGRKVGLIVVGLILVGLTVDGIDDGYVEGQNDVDNVAGR